MNGYILGLLRFDGVLVELLVGSGSAGPTYRTLVSIGIRCSIPSGRRGGAPQRE